jgi:DNA-binding beta-propeller fold protein YncE
MPPLRLTSVLHTALPHLSENGRALLSVLGCFNGHPPCSHELAQWLGFHDRYQLARALRREGLPPLEVIGGWARTLYWMSEAEGSGKSLRELAEREKVDPAIAYRLVRRVTGRRWSEVRREGLALTMLRFRDRCAEAAPRRTANLGTPRFARVVGDQIPRPFPPAATTRPIRGPSRGAETRARTTLPRPGHRVAQSISERVAVDGAPFDVAFAASGEALVTRPHAAAVDVLQLNPFRVSHTIRVGPTPTRVIPTARDGKNGHVAYVTTQFVEAVRIIDTERRQMVDSIPVPGHPLSAVMSPDGHTLFVTTNQDRLVAISTAQRTVVGSTAIPLTCPQLTIHPSGRWLLVPCWRAGVIVEVDASTLEITRRFDVGGVVQDLVVAADGQSLYAANEAGWLDVIHLPSGRRTAKLEFGTGALGLAMSADQAHLFIGLLESGRVLVLQRQGLIERAVIATGGRPRLIAPHPSGDAVLVANEAGWVDLLH